MDNKEFLQRTGSAASAFAELFRHVVLITGAFLLIASVAIGLDRLLNLLISLEWIEKASPTSYVLTGAKLVLLGADIILLFGLVYKFGRKALQSF